MYDGKTWKPISIGYNMKYWLMKSEPSEYSIDQMEKDGSSCWFGVRNYQARNFMMRDMQIGDRVVFYHSTCKFPGIYGIIEVSSLPVPDETQFQPGKYFEPRATKEKPVWYCVEVKFIEKFRTPLMLSEIRNIPELSTMKILERGNRLSITPMTEAELKYILGSFVI